MIYFYIIYAGMAIAAVVLAVLEVRDIIEGAKK